MPSLLKALGLLMVCTAAQAGTAPILLEACNLFDERDKRLACLRAANGLEADAQSAHPGSSRVSRAEPVRAAMPQALGSFDGATGAARSSGPSGVHKASASGDRAERSHSGTGVRSPARVSPLPGPQSSAVTLPS